MIHQDLKRTINELLYLLDRNQDKTEELTQLERVAELALQQARKA
jgi:hypothetical protein